METLQAPTVIFSPDISTEDDMPVLQANRVVSPHTFGKKAVELFFQLEEAQVTRENILTYRYGSLADVFELDEAAEEHQYDLQEILNKTRGYFLTRNGMEADMIDGLLGGKLRGTQFMKAKQLLDIDQQTGWTTTLGKGFSDEQLLEFLKWNMAETQECQALLEKSLPDNLNDFCFAVEWAVDQKWLPEAAKQNLDVIGDVDFFAGDIFSTSAKHMSGYFLPKIDDGTDRDLVVVANEVLVDYQETEDILFHELVHVTAGRFETKGGIRDDQENVWLDEAMTEHIAMALMGRTGFDKPYPYKLDRRGYNTSFGRYEAERSLLSIVTRHIPMQQLINVYFETDKTSLEPILRRVVELVGAEAYTSAMHDYGHTNTRVQATNVINELAAKAKANSVKEKPVNR